MSWPLSTKGSLIGGPQCDVSNIVIVQYFLNKAKVTGHLKLIFMIIVQECVFLRRYTGQVSLIDNEHGTRGNYSFWHTLERERRYDGWGNP